MIYLVTIQNKTLYGEPDVALAVVDAPDEETAVRSARPTIEQLAERGHGRCVPHVRMIEAGKFYRLGAVIRLPLDPNAEEKGDAAVKISRYGAMCIPGRADDGSDSAWFVAPVGRYFRSGTAIYVGEISVLDPTDLRSRLPDSGTF